MRNIELKARLNDLEAARFGIAPGDLLAGSYGDMVA